MEPDNEPIAETTAGAWTAHASELLGWLQRRTGDPDLAQDVVSEAYLRLAREERQGRFPGRPRSWLFQVAANLVTSHGRHLQVVRRELARTAAVEAARPSAEVEVAAREALREAIAAAGSLSAGERRVLALAAAECSNVEMAEALGVSPEAARTRLCRARAHLAAALVA